MKSPVAMDIAVMVLLSVAAASCNRPADRRRTANSASTGKMLAPETPLPDGRLPDGCELAVRINLAAVRGGMSSEGVDGLYKLSSGSAVEAIIASGMDPLRTFDWAELCRMGDSDGHPTLIHYLSKGPTKFLEQLSDTFHDPIVTERNSAVLRHDRIWMARRNESELFVADSESLLGAVLEEKTSSYTFPPDALMAIMLDRRGFQVMSSKINFSAIPELANVQTAVLAFLSDRSTIIARLTSRDALEATNLAVGISRSATFWKRHGKTNAQIETRVEGREAVVTAVLPSGAAEAVFRNIGKVGRGMSGVATAASNQLSALVQSSPSK